MTAAQQKVAGAISAQAVELNLNQIVAKGDGTNWETKITEFTNPITLSLGINNYDANYDYVVVRDHNGTTTALPTKVIDGKVTFETNQFSTYVIVKRKRRPQVPVLVEALTRILKQTITIVPMHSLLQHRQ